MDALKAKRGETRGIAIIETAIILPLVLLLTMGLLEYGWMFVKIQQITNAARQGARVGARADVTNAEVQAAVLGVMTSANLETSGYQLVIGPADITVLEPGQMLTVTITVPYANVGLGLPLTPTPANLASTTVMVREGS